MKTLVVLFALVTLMAMMVAVDTVEQHAEQQEYMPEELTISLGSEAERASRNRLCMSEWCFPTCRSLGFAGGFCVGIYTCRCTR